MFGLQSLSNTNNIDDFDAFEAEAGEVPVMSHLDVDKKLIRGKACWWIGSNKSWIKAAPASQQSSKGLVKAI
jgi:hypothetical protein